jgi:hypothetical protein
MDASQIVVDGVLRSDGTLEVTAKLDLPPGPVRVTIQSAPAEAVKAQRDRKIGKPAGAESESAWTVLEQIWARGKSQGVSSRTAEEIDADIRSLRAEWDQRQQELERIQNDSRRPRE